MKGAKGDKEEQPKAWDCIKKVEFLLKNHANV